MMASNAASAVEDRGVPPVFVPCRNLPDGGDTDKPYTVHEICAAAEKTSGYNTIIGAQRIGGLWRLYPKTMDSRTTLLLKALEIRHHTVTLFDKNPFIVRTLQGEREAPTTKLIIGNLPISYSNEDIERKLVQIGCEPHSKLLMERDRDEKGGLTRWLTGRRFVYIKVPTRPLPEKINIGPATATLYHREQKQNPENAVCSRCLATGHRASSCVSDVVCRTCKKSGHKSGHPSCPMSQEDTDVARQPEPPSQLEPVSDTSSADDSSAATETTGLMMPPQSSPQSQRRGREPKIQSRLNFQSRSLSRSREKRPLSSPPLHCEATKTARMDDGPPVSSDDPTSQASEGPGEGT